MTVPPLRLFYYRSQDKQGLWFAPLFCSTIGCYHISPSLFGNHGNVSSGGEGERRSILLHMVQIPVLNLTTLNICMLQETMHIYLANLAYKLLKKNRRNKNLKKNKKSPPWNMQGDVEYKSFIVFFFFFLMIFKPLIFNRFLFFVYLNAKWWETRCCMFGCVTILRQYEKRDCFFFQPKVNYGDLIFCPMWKPSSRALYS